MSALAILGHLALDVGAEIIARVRVAARVLWWGGALDAQDSRPAHPASTPPEQGAPRPEAEPTRCESRIRALYGRHYYRCLYSAGHDGKHEFGAVSWSDGEATKGAA